MKHNINLKYYQENILECLQDIDFDRYYHDRIQKKSLRKLFNLSEAYFIMSKINNDSGAICEANQIIKRAESLAKEYKYRRFLINEGFENPFDDVDDDTINTRYDDFVDDEVDDKMRISGVRLWKKDINGKIFYKNGRMFAGKFFGVGDTIEKCPVRLIYDKDMYSENIRDFAFTIDKRNGIYAIPFGYASFYRNSNECNIDPNADYEYIDDESGNYIRIFSTKNIKKNHEIVLDSNELLYDNEIKPGQFEYDAGPEPFYSVKNIKIA